MIMTRAHNKKMQSARTAKLSPKRRSQIARIAALARAESLTPERRSEIAGIGGKHGARARWGDKRSRNPAARRTTG